MLCMYSGRIPAAHSIQWPPTVSRFQAALVGVRWWCAQARCMGCVQNHSCPDVQDNVSNDCYSTFDSFKCLILNYFLAATYSDTFHCCQSFHSPTLSYLTSCGLENLCSKTKTNKQIKLVGKIKKFTRVYVITTFLLYRTSWKQSDETAGSVPGMTLSLPSICLR